MGKDFDIIKLKGSENFHTWKFAVEAVFDFKGLGDALVPKATTTPTVPKESDDTKLTQAKALLKLAVEPHIYAHLEGCADALAIWTKLKTLYEDRGLLRRITLLRELISIRLEENDGIQEYVDSMRAASNRLAGIGFKLDDEWLAAMMLAGLTDEFKTLIMGLESTNTNITSDLVTGKLLDMKSTSARAGEAFFGKKGKNKKARKCYSCGSLQHLSNQCDKKNDSSKNEKKEKNDGKNGSGKKRAFCAFFNSEKKDSEWYIDSGCSAHMTGSDSGMRNVKPSSVPDITSACKSALIVKKQGDITIQLPGGDIDVENVLHVPQVAVNLLSVSQICKKDNIVVFDRNGCTIKSKKGAVLAHCDENDGVYKLRTTNEICMLAESKASAITWHRRLGHMNVQSMRKMRDGAVSGIAFRDDDRAVTKCETCACAKQTRLPFPQSKTRSSKLLELIHTDVMGPLETQSIGHAKYLLTFIDDFSKKVFVYFIKNKHQVFDMFMDFKALVENQTGEKIKILRSDNGTEYCSEKCSTFFRKHGIRHQTTNVHTPQQNGVAERMNRTLTEKTRCLLFDANLPKTYWAEAMNMAAYLINRSICASLGDKTPEEVYTGEKIDLSNLKIFGSGVMVHVPKANRKKLDRKSRKLIFVGYDSDTKGYRCIDEKTRKLTISRDVIFHEESLESTIGLDFDSDTEGEEDLFNTGNDDENQSEEKDDENQSSEDDIGGTSTPNATITAVNVDDETRNISPIDDKSKDPDFATRAQTEEPAGPRVSERTKKQYVPFKVNYFALFTEPTTLKEARENKNADKWNQAMREELESHAANNTWTLVDLPRGRKTIKAKWVYKVKSSNITDEVRFKARLVAKGYSQRPGIDYSETYAPVVRYATLRILFAMTVKFNLRIYQMDAVTAFLQGELSETIYMDQPEGFSNGTDQVCRLNKAVYGLKQAGRTWNLKLNDALLKFGLKRSKMDPCVYYNFEQKLFVAIYVDDFLIFFQHDQDLNRMKSNLHDAFHMKEIGEARECLGMRIKRGQDEIEIDQTPYIEQLVVKFGVENEKTSKTPGDANTKLSIKQWNEKNDVTGKVAYQELIGSLLYLAERTRPDIAFAVNDASRFNQKHCEAHWQAVLRILRYLHGTKDAKLVYKTRTDDLHAYSDADWASDIDKRRSCTGYAVIMSGAAITWRSQRQETVAQSSTEAEYLALSSTVNEIKWVTQFINEISNSITDAVTVYCDNQSAIKLGLVEAYRERTKHIDIRYHHIREKVDNGLIGIEYISTNEMTADVLTKPLTGEKTRKFAGKLGLKL